MCIRDSRDAEVTGHTAEHLEVVLDLAGHLLIRFKRVLTFAMIMKFGNVLLDHAAVFMARRKCLAKSAIRGEVAVTTVCNVSRQGLQHRFETPVPAGLQKVRTHRGRVDARRNRVGQVLLGDACLLYTSPSPRDATLSRMPSSA